MIEVVVEMSHEPCPIGILAKDVENWKKN